MKKITNVVAVSIALLLSSPVHAGLITNAPVNGLATFKDTSTNLVWIKLPELFGKSFTTQSEIARAAGFTVADYAAVSTLINGSAQISNGGWYQVADIVGDSFHRDLMWGNFSTSATNSSLSAYAFAYDTSPIWYTGGYGYGGASNSDLGLFAYRSATTDIPEPMSAGLMGLGLVGLALSRRRKSAK